jgi:hypothetical protein
MAGPAPTIYAPVFRGAELGFPERFGFAVLALGCAVVLGIAAWIKPSADGLGSHTELGLPSCAWVERFHLPCPSCGFTTSFAHFARGNLVASFYVQPMGCVLAILTTATFWVSLYIALTGRPALRLLRLLPTGYLLMALMFFGLAAWAWKIYTYSHGISGWG